MPFAPRTRFATLLPLSAALTAMACGSRGSDAASSEAASTSANPSLHCVLDYQSFQGNAIGPVGQADGNLAGGVDVESASSPYKLQVTASPAGTSLSVQASILGPSGLVAYALLPRSVFSAGDYAFELGGPIPSVHGPGYDGQDHDYDAIRGYCQTSAGADDGGPPPPDAGTQAALDPKYFDSELPPEGFFLRRNPDPSKVSVDKLDALLAQAAQQGSDAVVIAQDDVIIAEKYFGKGAQLAPVMSVTKSVTSLAVGALIDEGKIASVDVPLSTYFPEWGTGQKASATLRHALTMTVGLEDSDDFWNHDDLLAYVRAQPLAAAPGAHYSYSNESAMLFSGIIANVAGMPADQYVKQKFFTPIGITDAFWATDAAGNVQTPGGLSLTPLDLLRLGTLASHGGTWGTDRLVSSSWLATSTANQTPLEWCYGYLWWVVRPGCDGENFGTSSQDSPVEGAFMDGWGGDYVTVIPSSHIVAVRTRYPGPNATPEDELRTRYLAFTQDAAGLGAR